MIQRVWEGGEERGGREREGGREGEGRGGEGGREGGEGREGRNIHVVTCTCINTYVHVYTIYYPLYSMVPHPPSLISHAYHHPQATPTIPTSHTHRHPGRHQVTLVEEEDEVLVWLLPPQVALDVPGARAQRVSRVQHLTQKLTHT